MRCKKRMSAFLLACMLGTMGNPLTADAADLIGDVNADGIVSAADAKLLASWLCGDSDAILSNPKNADVSGDQLVNAADLALLKRKLLVSKPIIRVTNTEELKSALENAQAGDEIVVAEGTYVYSGSTPKGYMFRSEADGTEDAPIVLRAENPENPPILSGTDQEHNSVLVIWGDCWIVDGLKTTNAQKGILVRNSNHTIIRNCEIYETGQEGMHFLDNSSYCLAENCYIHDTGTVTAGYGEAIYIGSAKSTTEYGYQCDYNTVRGCRLGPNVAAEHIDVKEYTTGTLIEDCRFDGKGMTGENYADAFVNLKGNDCVLRNCVGYRNGCDAITRAFEQNQVVDGWGQNAFVYGNKVYMDKAMNDNGRKMYFHNAWDCSVTLWENFMAYDGELFSVDDERDHWNYYNCNLITYGDASDADKLPLSELQ